jgi:signal transduction histidine kinase
VPHIFERFYRAEADRDRSGAGIGLSIAAVSAEAHDATIRIDSKVGEGTTICVELPLATAVAKEPRPPVSATT